MAFKCSGCGVTYPEYREQTGTLGQPKLCPACYEQDQDDEVTASDDAPTKAVKAGGVEANSPWRKGYHQYV